MNWTLFWLKKNNKIRHCKNPNLWNPFCTTLGLLDRHFQKLNQRGNYSFILRAADQAALFDMLGVRSGWYTHTAVFTDNRNSRTQICAINHFSSHAHTRRHTSRWVIWALTTPLLHFHSSIFFWDSHTRTRAHTHAGSRGYKKKAS